MIGYLFLYENKPLSVIKPTVTLPYFFALPSPTPKIDDNSIVEIYESGYKYKDLIIRHAKVVVNKK